MKKFLPLLVSFIFFVTLAKAQYVTIPDPNFRQFLKDSFPSCFNSSDMMDTTCSAILNASDLYWYIDNIQNLDGIQYFKSLSDFTVNNGNDLINIPALSNSLTYLSFNSCTSLTGLTLPNSLTYFELNG